MNTVSFDNLSVAVSSLGVARYKTNDERLTNGIGALQLAYSNGGALFAMFDLSDKSSLRELALHRDWQDSRVIEWFIQSPAITQAIPELQHEVGQGIHISFDLINPFLMVGELASCLFYGGAYRTATKSASDSFSLALGFCDAVFGNRFDDVRVYRTYEAWSDWFAGIAWDKTWVVFDKSEWRVSLLCVTDTD